MSQIWAQYARYNRLANEALYGVCVGLSDADYRRDLGAFFGSVHGTLNHLLLGDTIWMTRFEGGTHPSTGLDAIPVREFAALRDARRRWIAGSRFSLPICRPGFEAGRVKYLNNAGVSRQRTRGW
jgi:uncharacterized damage-inducible protein DinB